MLSSPWVTWPALTKYGSIGAFAGLLVISSQRQELLNNNMFDVEQPTKYSAEIECDERSLTARTEDGTCNILDNPAEGAAFVRFGRNVNPNVGYAETEDDLLLTPNPREVSNLLMSRGDAFKPATSLNFIAVAWIQFMVHDWFDHGPRTDDDPILVPLPENDPLGSGNLTIRRTQPDPTRSEADDHLPQTFRNYNTHWWDGSQIYGSDKNTNTQLRAFVDGKLKVNADNTLPTDYLSGKPITGFNENWWLGLSMMHRLFVLEHNAIADMLKQKYPAKNDQWLYDHARLINAALMAKIHTVEWTPAILDNPVTWRAMYNNWWGVGGDRASRNHFQDELDMAVENLGLIGDLLDSVGIENDLGEMDAGYIEHSLGGLVGARTPANYGVPYTLTEEFVAVYRMHPLLRDNIDVYDIGSNIVSTRYPLQETRDGDAEDVLNDEGADRLWYSFGITHPGALTLNNYPDFMRSLSIPLVGDIDMATIDIIRDRERGIPRYNEFRRQIGLVPITQFEDLTSDPTLLQKLKTLYNNDVELIDTLVGQLAEETRPEGFGFGETAFQIFIVNASRRLMTDRFFTSDYRPEIYTAEGIDWVEDNTMVDVIKRHYPSLSYSLVGMTNAFQPWGLNMPEDYQSWPAASKQNHLWVNGALRTTFKDALPPLVDVDMKALISSVLWQKVNRVGDVAPAGYVKPIHPMGALAKVKFTATENTPYTGLFKGADHGFLRMSVTGDPGEDDAFIPGLALKLMVDGKRSENISALYTLTGQGRNHDIFANELSNYVHHETEALASILLFSTVSSKPTLLMANDLAKVKQNGNPVLFPKAPTQIYFVPHENVQGLFLTEPHDFRDDLQMIPEGTTVYEVLATSMPIKTSLLPHLTRQYAKERRDSAVKIGELSLTSPFTVSAFGDSGMFFKHQRFEDQ
ncbi:hypothetical protein TDB9533_01082 [Thalassocella blandensis]|nr:hypothetical protein TDB9533_01082 [Thalassocella blandensis]